MIEIIEAQVVANDNKFVIIVGRFNNFITERLTQGALDALHRSAVKDTNIKIVKVPGAFEIPLIAKKIAEKKLYNAIICLGSVIRGDTPHFDYVCAEASKGIAIASFETGIPIIFGILTTDSIEQAIERAGTKSGNKGWDSAISAIEMANLMNRLD